MSGQLSFSVALLNAAGDGVVISSINRRSETRTYAKVVLGGTGTQELSPEEEQAVRSARLGTGLPGRDGEDRGRGRPGDPGGMPAGKGALGTVRPYATPMGAGPAGGSPIAGYRAL